MINTKTMNILNRYGFGADINALESYLFNYAKIYKVADMDRYANQYKILVSILNEVKPSSQVFCGKIDEPIQFDYFDAIFKEIKNIKGPRIFGRDDKRKMSIALSKAYKSGEMLDIIAYQEVLGLDINIIYENGGLCKIYCISEDKKIFDLTDLLYKLVPNELYDIEDIDLTEVRAVITTKRQLRENDNPICAVYNDIRNNDVDNIKVIATDVFFDEIEQMPFRNYWKEIEYLKSLGFETIEPCLVRNISVGMFYNAIDTVQEYLEGVQCDYKANGIVIKDNARYRDNETILIYDKHNVESNKTFISRVKGINKIAGKLVLNIVEVECNDCLKIDSIEVDDVFLLEELKISVGNKAKFKLICGKAVLVK